MLTRRQAIARTVAAAVAAAIQPAWARHARGASSGGGAGFQIITTSPVPAVTQNGAYFLPLATSGGTGAVTFELAYSISAAVSTFTKGPNCVLTLSTVSGSNPFAGLSQITFYNQVCTITSTGGSSGAWTVTTTFDSSEYNPASTTAIGGAVSGVAPWQLTTDGWLYVVAGTNESGTVTVKATDSATPTPHTATKTFSYTVNSTPTIQGIVAGAASQPLPAAMQSNAYSHTMRVASLTGTVTWSATGLPAGLSINSSTGAIFGSPTGTGTTTGIVVQATNGTSTASATFSMAVAANANVSRPAYNATTSNGFFVLNGGLYDPSGAPFRIRGTNRNHIDQGSGPAFALTGQAAMRCFLDSGAYSEATQEGWISSQLIANGQFAVVTRAFDNAGNSTSGSSVLLASSGGKAGMQTIVQEWVSAYSAWAPTMESIAINIANEWGDPNNTTWEYAYQAVSGSISSISGSTITLSTVSGTNPFANALSIGLAYIKGAGGVTDQVVVITGIGGSSGAWTVTMSGSISGYTSGGALWGGAVGILRAAGYTCPLVIDSGADGQDINDLLNYSSAVFNSDPLKNIIFSFHFYGLGNSFPPGSTLAQMNTILADLASLQSSVGAVYIFGEFSTSTPPLQSSVASPTLITAGQVIEACESYGIGWLDWAFDDNNLGGNQCGQQWFGHTLSSGVYTAPSDLTYIGQDALLNPTYGVAALSTPASYLI